MDGFFILLIGTLTLSSGMYIYLLAVTSRNRVRRRNF